MFLNFFLVFIVWLSVWKLTHVGECVTVDSLAGSLGQWFPSVLGGGASEVELSAPGKANNGRRVAGKSDNRSLGLSRENVMYH